MGTYQSRFVPLSEATRNTSLYDDARSRLEMARGIGLYGGNPKIVSEPTDSVVKSRVLPA